MKSHKHTKYQKQKVNSTFTFEKKTSTNIRQLILELNSRKPMGIDTIPPKIMKMLKELCHLPDWLVSFNCS